MLTEEKRLSRSEFGDVLCYLVAHDRFLASLVRAVVENDPCGRYETAQPKPITPLAYDETIHRGRELLIDLITRDLYAATVN